jgi:hypothetical protein
MKNQLYKFSLQNKMKNQINLLRENEKSII